MEVGVPYQRQNAIKDQKIRKKAECEWQDDT